MVDSGLFLDECRQELDNLLSEHNDFLRSIDAKNHLLRNKDSQIVVTFPTREHLRFGDRVAFAVPQDLSTLYVHIPYCTGICSYCSYVTKAAKADDPQVDIYLNYVLRELDIWRDRLGHHEFETCYIGGGTPTFLSVRQIIRLLTHINSLFCIKGEYTLEGSPETIDQGKLLAARELGINRISIGVESWNDHLLQGIRRRHDVSLAERTVELIQSCDLPLDIDLIRGLPGSDLDTIFRDAHTSAGLNIDSVTSYQYTQKPRSIDSKINNYDLDRQDTMLQHLCFRRLMQHYGYTENPVDWFACRNNFYSHNILKWQHNADQISVGLGSYGYVGGCSYTNHAREANYYLALDQYLLPIEKSESLTLGQQMQRHIVFGLKTGVNLTDVQEQYDQNVWCGEFGQKLQSLLTQGVLQMHDHKIKPTEISRLITDDLQVWLCQPTI